MIAVNTQTIIFLQALLMGAVFGVIYDLFRIFRIAVPLPAGAVVAKRCDLLCFLQLYVFLFDDDGEFRSGSLFYFAGGIAWLFIVLSDPRDVGDEVRAAPHCLYPLDFSGSLEIAPAAGGSSDQVDWQKSGKTFWETGKKREKSCAKTQKTLANKANIIV